MSRHRDNRPEESFAPLKASYKVSQGKRLLPCPECGEPSVNAPQVCVECARDNKL